MSRVAIPCAIYTRKSSEEGLEQGFNSLDAQREACEAFILSQKQEGWKALPTLYDDGGYSGGNMDRPALKQLLADIDQQKIKVVVVYKVDRLTRSLADFAKIVEQFDAKGISFVSVTQQFNTTSSMGRLTLNVLLSFAQFEREVTGERIRDKIAASKAKGMWMGGTPPIGYVAKERTLEIEPIGAQLIKRVFAGYLERKNVRDLKEELQRKGVLSPIASHQSGKTYGGKALSRGQLYGMLSNPIYIGCIAHKNKTYPGQHPPIIDQETWNKAHEMLKANKQGYEDKRSVPSASLLTGIIFDGNGHRLVPSHSQKKTQRYRYYVSEPLITGIRAAAPQAIRIPALELEKLVVGSLRNWLLDSNALSHAVNIKPEHIQSTQERVLQLTVQLQEPDPFKLIHKLIKKVTIHENQLRIDINLQAIFTLGSPEIVRLSFDTQIKRCGRAMRLLMKGSEQIEKIPDSILIEQISKSHEWLNLLTSGKVGSIKELAAKEEVSSTYVARVLDRALLAPDIVRAIINGTQPPEFNLESLKQYLPLPIDWNEQRQLLGF